MTIHRLVGREMGTDVRIDFEIANLSKARHLGNFWIAEVNGLGAPTQPASKVALERSNTNKEVEVFDKTSR